MSTLSEADDLCRELDTLRELQTRVQELEAERDQLEDELISSREAHKITLGLLAAARNERDTIRFDNRRTSW